MNKTFSDRELEMDDTNDTYIYLALDDHKEL